MDETDAATKRRELRRAIYELRDRGLYQSAKWAAEQAVGFRPLANNETSLSEGESVSTSSSMKEDDGEGHDEELFLLAKAYFDLKEYRRCAHALRSVSGRRSLFLRCYALYLAGEKRKSEEAVELAGMMAGRNAAGTGAAAGGTAAAAGNPGASAANTAASGASGGAVGFPDAMNTELEPLAAELSGLHERGLLDSFGKYLYGVILADRDRKVEARDMLVASVNEYPWHWGAWQALQGLCTDEEVVQGLPLNKHWMYDFFEAALCLELQQNTVGLERYSQLQRAVPDSDYVVTQAAIAHYNLRDFDEAQNMFQEVLQRDPFRIDGMDMYSNILYVKMTTLMTTLMPTLMATLMTNPDDNPDANPDDNPGVSSAGVSHELSFLAHRAALTDKYRPETCCIIGNYYSLKGQHEKAVLYFSRALKLNRNYLSAWTLMGHEYVEMKNPAAAIDAYRRAVDINPRDYRAWYGLGQTYELLQMPYYALYYYRRATQLRPQDARMWCAMGQCYEHEQLNMDEAAIRCYRRAVDNNDREGIALHKLAKLHAKLRHHVEAAHFYARNLKRLDAEGIDGGNDSIEALLFLANYCKEGQRYSEAEKYCTRLLDFGGPAKEDAKALLREIRSVLHQRAQNPVSPVPGAGAGGASTSPGGMSMSPASPTLRDNLSP
ncbi:anaphase-promoting complex component apc8 [Cymbomonas tetramitiformis]|uniref:Anaphase-promoting complex component apc8 n=1 Tax=Cymbomonas tetramitiformis TaxID=36881 RepID=A0AAE0EUE7_9CHLO|nr:anaphase-promoting complex component apc8 [Cymbomonas tetramitiformis]